VAFLIGCITLQHITLLPVWIALVVTFGGLFSGLVACTSTSTHGISRSIFDHELTSVELVVFVVY
jgi:hypothetical protein